MPGVTVGPPFKKMGMRDSPTSEVFFDDVKLGVEHLLGGKEKGRGGRTDTKESLGNERSGIPSASRLKAFGLDFIILSIYIFLLAGAGSAVYFALPDPPPPDPLAGAQVTGP
jgi:hypothetical protein